MNIKSIIMIGLLHIVAQQGLNAQSMDNIEVKRLSKNEVRNLLEHKKPVLNHTISEKLFAKVYILGGGEVLLVNEDGKGGLWKSLDDFNYYIKEGRAEISVFNLEGWFNKDSDIAAMTAEACTLLSSTLKKNIDYSEQSLTAVGKLKIKDLVSQKNTFYAILLYTCGYYAHHYGGKLSVVLRHDGYTYEPAIIGNKGRVYTPYGEYMKSLFEPPIISLKESIKLEHIKYNLSSD